MASGRLGDPSTSDDHSERASLGERLLWFCPAVGLIAGAVVLWLFGISLWTAVALVLLIVCPLIVAWVLAIGSRQGRSRAKP
jgi:predicted cobalt transporter CbtA